MIKDTTPPRRKAGAVSQNGGKLGVDTSRPPSRLWKGNVVSLIYANFGLYSIQVSISESTFDLFCI